MFTRPSQSINAAVQYSPPFGQADLTNCERELIHLAGSIQPHGALLLLERASLRVLACSSNLGPRIGTAQADIVGRDLADLGGDAHRLVRELVDGGHALDEPHPLRLTLGGAAAPEPWQGFVHCCGAERVVLEVEPLGRPLDGTAARVTVEPARIEACMAAALKDISASANLGALSDAVVKHLRELTGYDRVMVYKFDPDGHGKIIAEARDPRLESLLGHHYPATDIPQRARELYLRNRVRMLVDVNYEPVPVRPDPLPGEPQPLDMSMCQLRSMSPLHLQYLKNMGVTATVVISLVRESRLWGLIAAHHYSPRNLDFPIRMTCDLLSEVVATRIAAIENYAHAQVAILVRRIEQRLVEATSTEGDWRLALFRNPRTLLQPLDATGAALFHEGEILTIGDVPSTPELRALVSWIEARGGGMVFASSAVGRDNAELSSLTPVASGVLACKLSVSSPDYLIWFRKEQLTTVTWAGDPSKPMVNDNPLELSPRRSFAAWSEIVRGTAMPWSSAELALCNAIGTALADIVLQVNAVRLLIAEQQLAQIRKSMESSREPVLIVDTHDRILFTNQAFRQLSGHDPATLSGADGLTRCFSGAPQIHDIMSRLRLSGRAWTGEHRLRTPDGVELPVRLRAESVPGRDGQPIGSIMTILDLRDSMKANAAREHLELTLKRSAGMGSAGTVEASLMSSAASDSVISSILTNASLAAMDISDAGMGADVAPLFEELEASTTRAAELYRKFRRLYGE